MFNKFLRSLNLFFVSKGYKPYFPGEKQVYLFTQRPVLYRNFTPAYVQEAINELQLKLQGLGFLTNVTGKFDIETEEAVKIYQNSNNIYVDGIVGPLTWACLFYPKLTRGSKNLPPESQAAVHELQTILYKEGFLNKEPNGNFDRKTESAVKRFQRTYGLKDDGIVGAATWAVLLGMRQKKENKAPNLLYLLPLKTLFLCNQLLIIVCILIGIYHSPLSSTSPKFSTATALVTAYALTCIVPFLLESIPPLKQYNQQALPLFKYAPYVLTGMFWKPILNFLVTLFN
ncbi:peptidoglycan binding domain-containing protein [Calothrix sp. NIES-4071]|nr:peptidoglycan binding domain-containing protein [Calothrix sp. NIES-4071]BAZ57058.1 peptidoglycan binding domain-containing protein [Calothrix sp. NIES-4105]